MSGQRNKEYLAIPWGYFLQTSCLYVPQSLLKIVLSRFDWAWAKWNHGAPLIHSIFTSFHSRGASWEAGLRVGQSLALHYILSIQQRRSDRSVGAKLIQGDPGSSVLDALYCSCCYWAEEVFSEPSGLKPCRPGRCRQTNRLAVRRNAWIPAGESCPLAPWAKTWVVLNICSLANIHFK